MNYVNVKLNEILTVHQGRVLLPGCVYFTENSIPSTNEWNGVVRQTYL